IGNTLKPPHICPKCGKPLSLRKLTCPKCGQILSNCRFPKNLRILLWGGYYCKKCNTSFDKWGNKIKIQNNSNGSLVLRGFI
ncbi:MAG: hypothetical protein JW787_16070, partial [Sedimentisphaerales bacterium]|nr:hypothetical protein [Sedimentisphaerales bacterium]